MNQKRFRPPAPPHDGRGQRRHRPGEQQADGDDGAHHGAQLRHQHRDGDAEQHGQHDAHGGERDAAAEHGPEHGVGEEVPRGASTGPSLSLWAWVHVMVRGPGERVPRTPTWWCVNGGGVQDRLDLGVELGGQRRSVTAVGNLHEVVLQETLRLDLGPVGAGRGEARVHGGLGDQRGQLGRRRRDLVAQGGAGRDEATLARIVWYSSLMMISSAFWASSGLADLAEIPMFEPPANTEATPPSLPGRLK